MEHALLEVQYAGEEVAAVCTCGEVAKSAGADADAEAREQLEKHVEEAND